ncbi:MAG TPA: GNAT family N-acetyltransferase [Candidatus Dormibacteraeota bacterium]|jgi:GNAT superfamily N-acetyltransferase
MSCTVHYRVRQAEERDLDALARFEAQIAQNSFPDNPIVDLAAHRKRLAKAMARDAEGMLVAEDERSHQLLGWLWVSLNQNFTTGARYANFRSLALAPEAVGSPVADDLFQRGIDFARAGDAEEVVGKVNVSNVPMRLVYRKFRFHVQHLTMRRRLVGSQDLDEVPVVEGTEQG